MLDVAQKAYAAFLAKQNELSYNFAGMTAEQQNVEMLEYTRLKIAAAQEQVKNAQFLKDREAAFTALQARHNDERTALAIEWQNKENALV